MNLPKVSVIMASGAARPKHLERTLKSWERITYPRELVEFILINTQYKDDTVSKVAAKFPWISKFVECQPDGSKQIARVTREWNKAGRASTGDYVMYTMADELLGDYDTIQAFLAAPTEWRTSMRNYFLSKEHTALLETTDENLWLENPKGLELYHDFWVHRDVEGADNTGNVYRKTMEAKIYTHITGASREHWDYMNWIRDEKYGHFWIDSDIYFRENAAGRPCHTLEGVYCYHQWHPLLFINKRDREYDGYRYDTVAQARLLEPSLHINSGQYKL